jgi:hypothetical protein
MYRAEASCGIDNRIAAADVVVAVLVNALERNDRREEDEEESIIECCSCSCCGEEDEGVVFIPKPSDVDRKQSVATTQAEMKEGEEEDNGIISN